MTGLQDRLDWDPVHQTRVSQPEGGHMEHKGVAGKVIGCACRVYNHMGPEGKRKVRLLSAADQQDK